MTRGTLIAALSTGALCLCAADGVAAPAAGPMAAFEGVWTMNAAKSRMERAGPGGQQTRRADSFTWIFRRNGRDVDLEIYHEYPAPAPSKVMRVVTDGQFHPCRMAESCLSTPGDPREHSFSFCQVDARMATRVFRVRGEITEYNVYSVSADGKTLVAVSWSPSTPEYRNFQLFENRGGPDVAGRATR